GAVKAQVYGLLRTGAVAQFFAYALVDQHVGVDGHAQGQGDGGDARQGERGLQHGQHGQQQDDIERQAYGRKHTHQVVVDDDEDCNCNEAVQGGVKALLDVVGTQAWAYGALFNDFHGGCQGTGTQQQGRVGGFLGGHAAADL